MHIHSRVLFLKVSSLCFECSWYRHLDFVLNYDTISNNPKKYCFYFEKWKFMNSTNWFFFSSFQAKTHVLDIEQRLQGVIKTRNRIKGLPLSIEGHVHYLIQEASDDNLLCQMYMGWAPYMWNLFPLEWYHKCCSYNITSVDFWLQAEEQAYGLPKSV